MQFLEAEEAGHDSETEAEPRREESRDKVKSKVVVVVESSCIEDTKEKGGARGSREWESGGEVPVVAEFRSVEQEKD